MRRGGKSFLLEVPFDGVGSGVGAAVGELLAQGEDAIGDVVGDSAWVGVWAARLWLEGLVPAGVVSVKELSDPSCADPEHLGRLGVGYSGCVDGVDDDFIGVVLLRHGWHAKSGSMSRDIRHGGTGSKLRSVTGSVDNRNDVVAHQRGGIWKDVAGHSGTMSWNQTPDGAPLHPSTGFSGRRVFLLPP